MKTINILIFAIFTAIIIAENKITINTQVESTCELETSKVELELSLVEGDMPASFSFNMTLVDSNEGTHNMFCSYGEDTIESTLGSDIEYSDTDEESPSGSDMGLRNLNSLINSISFLLN